LSDTGILTCLDALTGTVIYEGGRPPVPATFTASLVGFGDRMLATSEDGDTFVIKAGATHEILRTNSIGEPVYPSLALAGGSIYIRGAEHLYAISPLCGSQRECCTRMPHNGLGAPPARPAGAERGDGVPASDGDGGSGGAKPLGLVRAGK